MCVTFPGVGGPQGGPLEAVLIDSLLSVDQYRGADKAGSTDSDGKPARDIAEVAAATELILPKGSARTTSSVSLPFLSHSCFWRKMYNKYIFLMYSM